jgi:hypothetical protein
LVLLWWRADLWRLLLLGRRPRLLLLLLLLRLRRARRPDLLWLLLLRLQWPSRRRHSLLLRLWCLLLRLLTSAGSGRCTVSARPFAVWSRASLLC